MLYTVRTAAAHSNRINTECFTAQITVENPQSYCSSASKRYYSIKRHSKCWKDNVDSKMGFVLVQWDGSTTSFNHPCYSSPGHVAQDETTSQHTSEQHSITYMQSCAWERERWRAKGREREREREGKTQTHKDNAQCAIKVCVTLSLAGGAHWVSPRGFSAKDSGVSKQRLHLFKNSLVRMQWVYCR